MKRFKILAINPGSTSTKIAVYYNEKSIFLKTIRHNQAELANFNNITDQFNFRKEHILNELKNAEIDIENFDAIVGRGGLIKPVDGGVYIVNEPLKRDLEAGILGEHASNLGGLIAYNMALKLPHAKAFIADPVVVDEMHDVARITGLPGFQRISIFHALNHKAVARQFAKSRDLPYEKMNLIVAHLGGGISVGAHYQGKVIDVNNALDGEGPLSPERSGSLPAGQLARLCFSGEYTYSQVKKFIAGNGGLMAYFSTNSCFEIEQKADDGNEKAKLLLDAMAYQVGKSIGQMAAVLHGEVHAILITGGIANNQKMMEYIRKMVSFIAPVFIYPGEDEMTALAQNGLMVLRGELACKTYT